MRRTSLSRLRTASDEPVALMPGKGGQWREAVDEVGFFPRGRGLEARDAWPGDLGGGEGIRGVAGSKERGRIRTSRA